MTATFSDFINTCKQKQQELDRELWAFHYSHISDIEFWTLLKAKAEAIMMQRGIKSTFIVDQYNKDIIRQLYYYLTGDVGNCKWNVHKGIYLMGKVGCGKSLLMYSYLSVQDYLTRKITETIHAKQLIELLQSEGGITGLRERPLFIDELGRENLEMKDYGNVVKPVIDLFAIRYEYGGRTYATSNFTLDTLEAARDVKGKVTAQRYGNFIRTRMDEMFNVVELPGENRRLRWGHNG